MASGQGHPIVFKVLRSTARGARYYHYQAIKQPESSRFSGENFESLRRTRTGISRARDCDSLP